MDELIIPSNMEEFEIMSNYDILSCPEELLNDLDQNTKQQVIMIIETMVSFFGENNVKLSYAHALNDNRLFYMVFHSFKTEFILSVIKSIKELSNVDNIQSVVLVPNYKPKKILNESNSQLALQPSTENDYALMVCLTKTMVWREQYKKPTISIESIIKSEPKYEAVKHVDKIIDTKTAAISDSDSTDRNVINSLCKLLQRMHPSWPLQFLIDFRTSNYYIVVKNWMKSIDYNDVLKIISLHGMFMHKPIILEDSYVVANKADNTLILMLYVHKENCTEQNHLDTVSVKHFRKNLETITHSPCYRGMINENKKLLSKFVQTPSGSGGSGSSVVEGKSIFINENASSSSYSPSSGSSLDLNSRPVLSEFGSTGTFRSTKRNFETFEGSNGSETSENDPDLFKLFNQRKKNKTEVPSTPKLNISAIQETRTQIENKKKQTIQELIALS